MGAVTSIVRQYVPASYAAMIGATNTYYSPADLQSLADFVKFRLYNTVVAEATEALAYNVKEQRLLGILTTIQFIPAAVDYWSDQLSSTSTTGTNESDSFFDHRPDLWKIFDRLTLEAQALATDLGIGLYAARGVIPQVSYGDNGRNILITEDPELWPPMRRKNLHPPLRRYIPWN
jgi:hypothetical protein